MNNIKVLVLAISINFTASVNAAENNNGTIDRSTDTNNISDCIGLTGADRVLCEQNMNNNSANLRPNDNSRINRNRNTQKNKNLNQLNDRDSKSRNSNSKDLNKGTNSDGASNNGGANNSGNNNSGTSKPM